MVAELAPGRKRISIGVAAPQRPTPPSTAPPGSSPGAGLVVEASSAVSPSLAPVLSSPSLAATVAWSTDVSVLVSVSRGSARPPAHRKRRRPPSGRGQPRRRPGPCGPPPWRAGRPDLGGDMIGDHFVASHRCYGPTLLVWWAAHRSNPLRSRHPISLPVRAVVVMVAESGGGGMMCGRGHSRATVRQRPSRWPQVSSTRGATMVSSWLVETDLSEEFDFYTRANVGEVFPDPVAPLSFFYFENESGLGGSEHGLPATPTTASGS